MTGVSFTNYLLASVLTGGTVMIMHGVLEGIRLFGFDGMGGLMGFIGNLFISALSGFVAIMLVDATGLLDKK
jgi:hypothetical protein